MSAFGRVGQPGTDRVMSWRSRLGPADRESPVDEKLDAWLQRARAVSKGLTTRTIGYLAASVPGCDAARAHARATIPKPANTPRSRGVLFVRHEPVAPEPTHPSRSRIWSQRAEEPAREATGAGGIARAGRGCGRWLHRGSRGSTSSPPQAAAIRTQPLASTPSPSLTPSPTASPTPSPSPTPAPPTIAEAAESYAAAAKTYTRAMKAADAGWPAVWCGVRIPWPTTRVIDRP